MDEKARLRKRVERAVGEKLDDFIWENRTVQDYVGSCLDARRDYEDYEEEFGFLVGVVEDRLELVRKAEAKAEAKALEGVKGGVSGAEGMVHDAPSGGHEEDEKKGRRVESDWFVSPVTTAMVQAMSEFFAGLAHQYPEVVKFRDKVLPDRFLTEDEAYALIASRATRTLPFEYFEHWSIPVVGHRTEILDSASLHGEFSPVDDWQTLRIDPPGITKTVHYARPKADDIHTWHMHLNGETVPIITGLPIESYGDHATLSWLWPGSLVHDLYELSEELANTFDWPVSTRDRFRRLGNEAAVLFILTRKAPEVHPIDARWETKQSKYLNPQWRIQLTIPPWLTEKEVLRAYRLMRGQMQSGIRVPKETTTLEVARFVWKQERLNGYNRPPWRELLEQWNKEHPGHRFKTYNELHKYFDRGNKAVRKLNFSWPLPRRVESEDE